MKGQILLLGGGYTLQQVAALLNPETFIITSRKAGQIDEFRKRGWRACLLDTSDRRITLAAVAGLPAELRIVVDSIPPVQEGNHPAQGIETLCSAFTEFHLQPDVIYLSTSSVFGVQDGSWTTEETSSNPSHPAAKARLTCEASYRKNGFRTCALRLPAIYGPGRGLGHALRTGSYQLIEDGSYWSNRIHIDDLARFIVGLLRQKTLPEVLIASDDHPAQMKDVVDYYCQKFSFPHPRSISKDEAMQRNLHGARANQRMRNSLIKKISGHTELFYPSYREGAATEF